MVLNNSQVEFLNKELDELRSLRKEKIEFREVIWKQITEIKSLRDKNKALEDEIKKLRQRDIVNSGLLKEMLLTTSNISKKEKEVVIVEKEVVNTSREQALLDEIKALKNENERLKKEEEERNRKIIKHLSKHDGKNTLDHYA